jgi:predicted DNA-binding protein
MAREMTETTQVRMTPQEAKQLSWLAKRDKRTTSSLIRHWLAKAWARAKKDNPGE